MSTFIAGYSKFLFAFDLELKFPLFQSNSLEQPLMVSTDL